MQLWKSQVEEYKAKASKQMITHLSKELNEYKNNKWDIRTRTDILDQNISFDSAIIDEEAWNYICMPFNNKRNMTKHINNIKKENKVLIMKQKIRKDLWKVQLNMQYSIFAVIFNRQ